MLTADVGALDVLYVGLDACHSETVQVSADESATEVRLVAEAEGSRDPAQCMDTTQVFLDAPLGQRRLIDEASGEVLVIPTHPRALCPAPCLNDPAKNPPVTGPRPPTASLPRASGSGGD